MDFEQLKTELAEIIKGVSFEQLVNKLVDFAISFRKNSHDYMIMKGKYAKRFYLRQILVRKYALVA